MKANITLKDLAQEFGVSMITVHRALQNKEGVSEATRAAIQKRARELGYTTNYLASSLKRKALRIAVVLPGAEGYGRFYYKYMWSGIERWQEEAKRLNVEVLSFTFTEFGEEQTEVLEKLSEENLDGLVTLLGSRDMPLQRVIHKMSFSGVKVVLIDDDLPNSGRICCVAPHDMFTGRMAAEFFDLMGLRKGKVLVAGGVETRASHIHNLMGFSAYLQEVGSELKPEIFHHYHHAEATYQATYRALQEDKDLVAVYAISARETMEMARALVDTKMQGRIKFVGCDLYPESAEYLRGDVLQGIIHNDAFKRGSMAFRILFDVLVKNEELKSDRFYVPISMIFKNNLVYFEEQL